MNAPLDETELALFDELASLCAAPGNTYGEIPKRYERDVRLRVPATVFNVLRQHEEEIDTKG